MAVLLGAMGVAKERMVTFATGADGGSMDVTLWMGLASEAL